MEQEFLPYKPALELKELGFDEPCWAWYNISDEDVRYCYSEGRSPITNIQEEWNAKIDNKPVENIGLPTFSQAFRFFREKHNLSSWIYNSDMINFFYTILQGGRIVKANNSYESYEETELACLKKLIEIVKSK